MSQLSQTERPSTKVNPPLHEYAAAYALWFVTFILCTLATLAIRDLYQMGMVLTAWHRYTVHAINQVATLILLLTLLAVVLGLEGYYRRGVPKSQIAYRFWRVMAILGIVLAATQGLRLVLEAIASAVNLISLLLFAAFLGLAWGAHQLAAQRAPPSKRVSSVIPKGRPAWFGWLLLAAIFVGGAVLLFLPIKFPLNPYDEGIALVNGARILAGDQPFRDYWAIYPPGQSYVLAALFRMAGSTVMVERVYDTLVRIALAVVIYLVTARMLPRPRWALVPFVSAVVMLAAATFYGYAVFPALLFSFLALLCAFLQMEKQRLIWLFCAGLAMGVCLTFRIDIGVYTGLALAVGLATAGLWVESSSQGMGRRLARVGVAWLSVAAGALLLALPFYGFLAANAGVEKLWSNLVVFPATVFHDVRHLPYPSLWPDWSRWDNGGDILTRFQRTLGDWLRFYLPILVYAATVAFICVAGARRRTVESRLLRSDAQALAVTVLGIGLIVQALSRYDAIHVLPSSLCVVILLVWLAQQAPPSWWGRPLFVAPVAILLVIPVLIYFLLPYVQLSGNVSRFGPSGCYSERPAASCVPLIPEQETILRLLDQLDPSGGPALSALLRHDQVFVNDVSLYFLAGRPIPTRYHELHPGVTTTLPVQEEMIGELERNDVEWLVLVDWPNPLEANASALSSGVTALDDYIRQHYERLRSAGWYQLWQRTQ